MNQTKLREKAANVSLDLGLMGSGAERIYDALLCILLEERERCAKVAENTYCEQYASGWSAGKQFARAIRDSSGTDHTE